MGLRAIDKKERVSGGESPPVVGSQRWPHLPLNHLLGGKPFLNHRPMVPRRDNSPTVPPFMTIAEREREREKSHSCQAVSMANVKCKYYFLHICTWAQQQRLDRHHLGF